MRATCEKLFQRYLKRFDARPGVYVQAERAKFDLTDEGGLFIEVTGEETGCI